MVSATVAVWLWRLAQVKTTTKVQDAAETTTVLVNYKDWDGEYQDTGTCSYKGVSKLRCCLFSPTRVLHVHTCHT